MGSAFSVALSALQAESSAIDVVGNNLANLNTTGYKAENVEFIDMMAQTLGGATNGGQVGMGVGPIGTDAQFTQGTLTTTNGPTDVALQGNGFFVVNDSNNQTLYTRDGSFQVNASGNLVTSTGQFVQGWSAVNGSVNPSGAIGNLTVPVGSVVPATATTNMSAGLNLNSAAPTTGSGSSFSAPIQVVDAQGSTHTLTATFQKTGTNAWSYAVTIPATDLTTGGTTSLATGSLTFDGSGKLLTPASTSGPVAISVTGLADGASDMSINWNLYDSSGNPTVTQVAQSSSVGNIDQDGIIAGEISSVSLENGGLLVATYSNGQQSTVGQLAVASIANPESLLSVGDNNLAATAITATPAIGAAGTSGRGTIVAGSLETSNADMATELTSLLSYERSYQAASRVITTNDQMLQETVNLIHP